MPSEDGPQLVERIPEELRFIRRFVNLNGKQNKRMICLGFINGLQKNFGKTHPVNFGLCCPNKIHPGQSC